MGSDDTGAQRATAREREGAFGNTLITADIRYSLLTEYYQLPGVTLLGSAHTVVV